MSVSSWTELFAYSLTLAGSLTFAKRSSTWRMRLLACTVALLSLCQTINVLRKHTVWINEDVGAIAQLMEPLSIALCLVVLSAEDRSSKMTGTRLPVGAEKVNIRYTTSGIASLAIASLGTLRSADPRVGMVEKRKEPRLPVDCPVIVTVLGGQSPLVTSGIVQDMSGSGLGLRLKSAIPSGSPVKIEGDGVLMLGEVCRCRPADGQYSLGVQVSEWLAFTSGIHRFGQAEERDELPSPAEELTSAYR